MGFLNTWLTTGLGAALNPTRYRVSGAEADPASPVYSETRKQGAAGYQFGHPTTLAADDPWYMLQALYGVTTADYHSRTDGTGSAQDTAGRAYIMGAIAELGKNERRNEVLQMVVDALMLPKKNAGYLPMSQQARGESITALKQMMDENRALKRDQPLEAQFKNKLDGPWGSRAFNAELKSWHRPHSRRAW